MKHKLELFSKSDLSLAVLFWIQPSIFWYICRCVLFSISFALICKKHLCISLSPFYSLREVLWFYKTITPHYLYFFHSHSNPTIIFDFCFSFFFFFLLRRCVLNIADISLRFVLESHAIDMTMIHDPVISGLDTCTFLTFSWPLMILCFPSIFHLRSSFLAVCCMYAPGILFLVSDLCLHYVSSPFKT